MREKFVFEELRVGDFAYVVSADGTAETKMKVIKVDDDGEECGDYPIVLAPVKKKYRFVFGGPDGEASSRDTECFSKLGQWSTKYESSYISGIKKPWKPYDQGVMLRNGEKVAIKQDGVWKIGVVTRREGGIGESYNNIFFIDCRLRFPTGGLQQFANYTNDGQFVWVGDEPDEAHKLRIRKYVPLR